MEERFPDEAEAAEDAFESEEHEGEVDAEVPEADALEQSKAVRSADDDRTDSVGDRPEADALDQARVVEDDEDDDRR